MNEMRIMLALGNISEHYVTEAFPTKRLPKKRLAFIIAAVLALLLATTAAAAVMIWHPALAEHFSLSSQQMEDMDPGAAYPDTVTESNGLEIAVIQTLVDGRSIYVLYELTLPEELELSDKILWDWEYEFFEYPIVQDDAAHAAIGGNTVLSREGNQLIMLMEYKGTATIAQGPLRMHLINLCEWKNGTRVPVLEGEWILEWELSFDNIGKTLAPDKQLGDKGNSTVEEIHLSPIFLSVQIVSDYENTAFTPTLVFADGSETEARGTHMGLFREAENNWGHLYCCSFRDPIDVEAVQAIRIGGELIPLK